MKRKEIIEDTMQMNEYLQSKSDAVVSFSENSNVFLSGAALSIEQSAMLESIAKANQRSIHLC